MNETFYKDIDTNFESAVKLSESEFTHDELIYMLKNGNIPQKQISALNLDTVLNKKEAETLINNLTGCDGKIREAVALKINQLLSANSSLYDLFNFPEIFADATIDINANICRLVVDSVSLLKNNETFRIIYLKKILNFIEETFSELDKFIYKDKKYVINKQLFKLYWCLEALKLFADDIEEQELLRILSRACQETEYTIREKAAQIVIQIKSNAFKELKETLLNDNNYYVREVFKTKPL